jgi:hypothetical protein
MKPECHSSFSPINFNSGAKFGLHLLICGHPGAGIKSFGLFNLLAGHFWDTIGYVMDIA